MGYLFLCVALTLNAAANVLMKIGADRLGTPVEAGVIERLLGNGHLLGGLALFGLNLMFYIAALATLNLSVAYPIMMAGGVLIVVTVSILHLGETLTVTQGAGVLFLLAGLMLVTGRSVA